MDDKYKKYTHIKVKDGRGRDFLCPVETAGKNEETGIDVNVCFENDIPGRYAARINVRET